MTGLYLIDNSDWFGTYGFAVSSGSADFLKPPDRKEPLKNDWADQNGTEVYTAAPKFKEKKIVVIGTLLADNEADFWTKYKAMFTLLALPGLRSIFVNELSRSFSVYYDSCTGFERLSRIKTTAGQKVGVAIDLTFIEPVPNFWVIPNAASIYYGAVAAIPTNSSGVIALPNSADLNTQNFILNTGTAYTKFVFSLPATITNVSVTDKDALDMPLSYAVTSFNVGGVSYKTYAITQTVPNLTNHRLNIIYS